MSAKQVPKTKIIAMDKEYPLSKLSEWDKNPRLNEEAIEAVSRSLSAFGGLSPIIADNTGRICAGHTRYKAALELGLKEFPTILVDFGSIAGLDDLGLSELLIELDAAGWPKGSRADG